MPNEPVILRCNACRTLNRVPSEKLSAHAGLRTMQNAARFPPRAGHGNGLDIRTARFMTGRNTRSLNSGPSGAGTAGWWSRS